MEEKKLHALLKEQTDEIQRHQKMLLEVFDHRLGIVAEVQTEHSKKFFEVTKKLDAVIEMVAFNSEQIEMIKNMLKRKVDLDEYEKLEKRVGLLEKKLHTAGI